MEMLSREQARRTYDRIGSLQDSQRFYEDPAIDVLLEHGDFHKAGAVFEFGCGTGRFAKYLLEQTLTPEARYRGIDISQEMVSQARSKIEEYAPRADVVLTNGELPTAEPTQSYDRFVSTYVLDLLSESDTVAVIDEAHRLLNSDGLLCLASITSGSSVMTRTIAAVTRTIHRLVPSLIGGCRPISLMPYLSDDQWSIHHQSQVKAYGIASEVVVASPRYNAR